MPARSLFFSCCGSTASAAATSGAVAGTYVFIAIPVFCFFGFFDRLYQFYRFGSLTNTYVGLVAKETLARDPDPALQLPLETPFHVGFFGALVRAGEVHLSLRSADRPGAVLLALHWRRLSPAVRAYTIATCPMLLAYICFYARYFVWSGDFAWGDRYVSTSAELVALLAIPLLLRYRAEAGRVVWAIGIVLLCHQHR